MLYECIREEGGIVDFDWCTGLLYPYYYHFDDERFRYRSASLIAFLGLLTEWEDGSGFPFSKTQNETHQCHDFEQYMDSFLKHSEEIRQGFPNTFYSISITLQVLLHQEDINATFSYVDKQKLSNYESLIKNIEIKESREVFKRAFEEARIFNSHENKSGVTVKRQK